MRLVKTRLRYQKIFALGFALGNIFLVASMVLAILHNVIIGHFCVGVVAYKRGENVL